MAFSLFIFVLTNVSMNGPIVLMDWARLEYFWFYVSLWVDGNQSDAVLFLNRCGELILNH
jgi:hypothetical protein